jgi:SAM-dependent methyltransferase
MTMTEMTMTDAEITRRYRDIFGLDDSIGIEQARKHWEVERRLTDRLLATTPDNRWEEFSRAYSELYRELPWLNQAVLTDRSQIFSQWSKLIASGARIFEVGSGKAELLKFLSTRGHHCTATEITNERGEHHTKNESNLIWRTTDGIHLADFEPEGHYDVVISTGVIEHFHPDDIITHFSHARRILRRGGRYIFTTPHIASGPHDLSRAFGEERAICMHLREYDYPSLGSILHQAGFHKVSAVFPPSRIYRKLSWTVESRLFYAWLHALDRCEGLLHLAPKPRRRVRSLMKLALMPDNIWLSATI